VLLDIRLGEENGLQLLERYRDRRLRPAILVLTAFGQAEHASAADLLGAAALVLQTTPLSELVAAIRDAAYLGEDHAAAIGPTLTAREQEIVGLVVDARSNDEVGASLGNATESPRGPPQAGLRAHRGRVSSRARGTSGARGLDRLGISMVLGCTGKPRPARVPYSGHAYSRQRERGRIEGIHRRGEDTVA